MQNSIEEQLSPMAKLWLERVSIREARKPGRIISEIIERCCELEADLGEEGMGQVIDTLIRGPERALKELEKLKNEITQINEELGNTNLIIRLYCAQLHARKNITSRGIPKYVIGSQEKEMLFEPSGEDDQEIN